MWQAQNHRGSIDQSINTQSNSRPGYTTSGRLKDQLKIHDYGHSNVSKSSGRSHLLNISPFMVKHPRRQGKASVTLCKIFSSSGNAKRSPSPNLPSPQNLAGNKLMPQFGPQREKKRKSLIVQWWVLRREKLARSVFHADNPRESVSVCICVCVMWVWRKDAWGAQSKAVEEEDEEWESRSGAQSSQAWCKMGKERPKLQELSLDTCEDLGLTVFYCVPSIF